MAVNTVARAYRELESAGILETRGRFGTFVARTDPADAAMATAAHTYATAAKALGVDKDDALKYVEAAFRLAEFEQGDHGSDRIQQRNPLRRPHHRVEQFAPALRHRQIVHGADAGHGVRQVCDVSSARG